MATLTFVYADSTAVVGPLATMREPHSWDLCVGHAGRITAPRGWELVRHAGPLTAPTDDDDLVALADAVRESHGGHTGVAAATGFAPQPAPTGGEAASGSRPSGRRRGHLRVLPDPG